MRMTVAYNRRTDDSESTAELLTDDERRSSDMMTKHTIVGVHITDRLEEATEVQQVLTQFGGQIKTRLGLHEFDNQGLNGILVLEMVGADEGIQQMCAQLKAIAGIEIQAMVFTHE